MIYFIRCNDIFSDPRLMKYIKYLSEKKINYQLIGWDRDGIISNKSKNIFFCKKAGYNVGGIKAVYNRILWMWFVLKMLIKEKTNISVIHACDLDTAFPAIIYKMFFNKKIKVIFDIFDWYSATLYNQGFIVLKVFSFMEKLCIKHSDYIIICEPERTEQIPFNINKDKLYILPNIPYFSNSSFLIKDDIYKFNNDKITFSYVGGFSNDRCLLEIIEIAAKGKINLSIAGFGNKQIQNRLEDLKDSPYIKYWGRVKYEIGLNIMYNSDIIYAMYAKTNPNHLYAAPNKLYESMFLSKAIFSTKGTIVERKINNMGIGYTSEEMEDDILSIIDRINYDDLIIKSKKSHEIWINKYSSYTINFLETDYQSIISK